MRIPGRRSLVCLLCFLCFLCFSFCNGAQLNIYWAFKPKTPCVVYIYLVSPLAFSIALQTWLALAPGGTRVMACSLETFITITIKDKKELIHCHMNTHNHMNINHVLCKYVYLERVVDPSCCCCFYTCQSLSALVYIHESMQPKPVVTFYIPDRSVYVYL